MPVRAVRWRGMLMQRKWPGETFVANVAYHLIAAPENKAASHLADVSCKEGVAL